MMNRGIIHLYAIFNGFTNLRFTTDDRRPQANFEGVPHFIYCAVTADGEPIVIDTGFSPDYVPSLTSDGAHAPGAPIRQGLKMIGFDVNQVRTVIMTHMHWDHTGGMCALPQAQFFVQAYEFNHMRHIDFREETCYCPAHWIDRLDRIRLVNGHFVTHHGLHLVCTGHHTRGHQGVVIKSDEHKIFLAGDEPSNYDQLWEAIPPGYWQDLKTGPGIKFFWTPQIKARIEQYVLRKEIDRTAPPELYFLTQFKQHNYRIFYSHDMSLPKDRPIIQIF